jgi:Asp-tRNA(Asn)/Glu-tRNA(Gln) amidotransferase A subunit family amidase
MPGHKLCFLTATAPAYGVRAKVLLAVRVTEAHLARLASPKAQVNAVVTLVPGVEREATMTSSARYQARRTWEELV